jgi:hypothetical protein
MPSRKSLRSHLYRADRDLGSLEAVERGRDAFANRVVRQRVYQATNRWPRRFLLSFVL